MVVVVLVWRVVVISRGGQKKPKKPNRLKNQIETEPKNRLTEPSNSVFVLFYTNLSFSFGFGLQNIKTVVSVNQQFQFWFRFTKYKNRGFG